MTEWLTGDQIHEVIRGLRLRGYRVKYLCIVSNNILQTVYEVDVTNRDSGCYLLRCTF